MAMIMCAVRVMAMPLFVGGPHGNHILWEESHGDPPVCWDVERPTVMIMYERSPTVTIMYDERPMVMPLCVGTWRDPRY